MVLIAAHRGFSSRHPESTRASYREAIAWSASTGVELNVECDVHFTADGELVCVHDLTIDRTSNGSGNVHDFTLEQLRGFDFGCRRFRHPTPDQRAVVSLTELLDWVVEARGAGAPVGINIETKHPNSRGTQIEERVAHMLAGIGWDQAGSPVRMLTFDLGGLAAMVEVLPELERTFLIANTFGRWASGELPPGCHCVAPGVKLLRRDPMYVARARSYGNEVHPWTLNTADDIEFCRDLGVTGYTTDNPARVANLVLDHEMVAEAVGSWSR